MNNKKTLVMGASANPSRYSYMAVRLLHQHQKEIIAFGLKSGDIDGISITKILPSENDIDTVTLYLNPSNQIPYVDYIMKLKPRRVIFNPGTENPDFAIELKKNGIEAIEACTLVMLNTGQY